MVGGEKLQARWAYLRGATHEGERQVRLRLFVACAFSTSAEIDRRHFARPIGSCSLGLVAGGVLVPGRFVAGDERGVKWMDASALRCLRSSAPSKLCLIDSEKVSSNWHIVARAEQGRMFP